MAAQCIQPVYVGKFQCDGRVCGGLCCNRGWGIALDEITYRKLVQLEAGGETDLLSRVEWNEEKKKGSLICRDGVCRFQGADLLCHIQKKYGPDYLPDICAIYPRTYRAVQGIVVRTLSVTCPIAADLALRNEAPMDFEAVLLENDRDMVEYQIGTDSYPPEVLKHFFPLQSAGISLLQDRALTLNQRLIRLGALLQEADTLIQQQRAQQIPRMISAFQETTAAAFPAAGSGLYTQRMAEIIVLLYQNVEEYMEDPSLYLAQLFQAFPALGEAGREAELAAQYEAAAAAAREKLKPFTYILENFLINEFFTGLYPFAFKDTIPQNYFVLAVIYKILEFFLVARATILPETGEKDIMEAMARLELRIRHLAPYTDRIRSYVSLYGQDMTAFTGDFLDGGCDGL